ncbi:MAG: PilZ domain-containing protein [Acidobacteriota bacterium]|nr:PilZ domain-containing protein [Acidobacteriota bacterium]
MPEDSQSDRRPSERKRIQMSVILVIENDEAGHATTVDLSPTGLRLQSNATLAPGQPVGLLLSTEPPSFIKARVVWVGTADSAQVGQAGFEFLNSPPEPEL